MNCNMCLTGGSLWIYELSTCKQGLHPVVHQHQKGNTLWFWQHEDGHEHKNISCSSVINHKCSNVTCTAMLYHQQIHLHAVTIKILDIIAEFGEKSTNSEMQLACEYQTMKIFFFWSFSFVWMLSVHVMLINM